MVSLNRPGLADVFNVICDETADRYRLILRHEMPGIGNDFEANGCAVASQSLFDHAARREMGLNVSRAPQITRVGVRNAFFEV